MPLSITNEIRRMIDAWNEDNPNDLISERFASYASEAVRDAIHAAIEE